MMGKSAMQNDEIRSVRFGGHFTFEEDRRFAAKSCVCSRRNIGGATLDSVVDFAAAALFEGKRLLTNKWMRLMNCVAKSQYAMSLFKLRSSNLT